MSQVKVKNKGVGYCFFCVCSTVEQTKGLAHASLVRRACCALIYVCTYVKVRGHPDNNLKLLVGWDGPPASLPLHLWDDKQASLHPALSHGFRGWNVCPYDTLH